MRKYKLIYRTYSNLLKGRLFELLGNEEKAAMYYARYQIHKVFIKV
ncbi:hypothetical protein [Macrococcus animalis]